MWESVLDTYSSHCKYILTGLSLIYLHGVRGKVKVAGTQQIDRCWNRLKNFCPSQMKHRTGATINGRFWDRIYQWIYRHNTSNWPKTKHLRAEKIACATFRREVHKIQFWKIAKNEAFWHIDVKNAGLWKSVLPCSSMFHPSFLRVCLPCLFFKL